MHNISYTVRKKQRPKFQKQTQGISEDICNQHQTQQQPKLHMEAQQFKTLSKNDHFRRGSEVTTAKCDTVTTTTKLHRCFPLLVALLVFVLMGEVEPVAAAPSTAFTVKCGALVESITAASLICSNDNNKQIAVPLNDEEITAIIAAMGAVTSALLGGRVDNSFYWRWHSTTAYPNRMFYYRQGAEGYTLGTWPVSPDWDPMSGHTGIKIANTRTMTSSNFSSDSCVVCEQRPCDAFCNSTGTASTSGTYASESPGCTCTCKPGFAGDDCSYQQKRVCQGAEFTSFAQAAANCRAIGAYVATPQSRAELTDITQQYVYGERILVGGSDEAVEGTWEWVDGPRKGVAFWTGGQAGPAPGQTGHTVGLNTIPFGEGEPNNAGGEDFSILIMNAVYPFLNDVPFLWGSVFCVACQLTTTCSDLCGDKNNGTTGTIADGTCRCQCTGGYVGKYCRCPPTPCDPRGGDVIETPASGCSCVCRPTYSGADCSNHTATPSTTISLSTIPTSSSTIVSTATPTSLTPPHTATMTPPTTPTVSFSHNTPSSTSSRTASDTLWVSQTTTQSPQTPSLTSTPTPTGTYSLATSDTSSLTVSATVSISGLTLSSSPTGTLSGTATDSGTTTLSLTTSNSLTVSKGTTTETQSTTIPTTATLSLPITETDTVPTPTKTFEPTLSCGQVSWRTACDALTWELSDGNVSVSSVSNSTANTGSTNGCIPSLLVPFSVWGNGDVKAAARFPPSKLLPRGTPPLGNPTNDVGAPAPLVIISSLADFAVSGGQVLEVVLQRRDDASLSRTSHVIQLPTWLFGCGLPFALKSEIVYEARPRSTASIETQEASTSIGTASSVLTGSPGAVVRGGVMSTVSGLMRCDGVDVTEEVSRLNNPMGISVGSEDGAYLRGSAMSGFVIICIGAVLCGLLVAGTASMATFNDETVPGWRELIARARLPSSVVSLVALSMEIGTGSAMTLLTMGTEFGSIGDRIGGAVYILAAAAYCGHVCSTCIRAPVHAVEVPPLPDESSTFRKMVKYLFEPTHELVLAGGDDEEETDDKSKKARRVRDREWVRRNAFYTADLRWPLFRGIELFVGLVANLVEGFAANSHTACLVQIIVTIITLCGTVVLLLVTRACSIRAMLWSTVLLNALMAVAAVLALVNVMAANATVEEGADWLLMLAAVIIAIQSALDIVLTAVTILPATRAWFSYLRKRFGEDVRVEGEDNEEEEMDAPLLLEVVKDELDEPGVEEPQPPQNTGEIDVEELEYVEDVRYRLADAPLEHTRTGQLEEEEVDQQVESEYSQSKADICDLDLEDPYGVLANDDETTPPPPPPQRRPQRHEDLPEDLLLCLEQRGFNLNSYDDDDDMI